MRNNELIAHYRGASQIDWKDMESDPKRIQRLKEPLLADKRFIGM